MSSEFEKILDGLPTSVSLAFASSKFKQAENTKPLSDGEFEEHDDSPPEDVTVVLQFSEKGFGFGEIAIRQTPEGVFLDTEYMNLEKVKKYVNLLLDQAVLDIDQDPQRHILYNRVMGRSCGNCIICNPEKVI
jgi:hypothetical protein